MVTDGLVQDLINGAFPLVGRQAGQMRMRMRMVQCSQGAIVLTDVSEDRMGWTDGFQMGLQLPLDQTATRNVPPRETRRGTGTPCSWGSYSVEGVEAWKGPGPEGEAHGTGAVSAEAACCNLTVTGGGRAHRQPFNTST